MEHTTEEFFKGMSQITFSYVFILQNTNMCISSIIYENPTTFWLMQRFEMTVINKFMLCPAVVFSRLCITSTYEKCIIDSSRNNGCNPGYYFYSRYWSHLPNISHTWGILYLRYIWIFHFSRRALSVRFLLVNIFSNSGGRIDDSIL